VRRPLPPELIALGDQLETAAGRAVGRRRSKRQLVLNAAASLVVGVPLAISVVSGGLPGAPVSSAPAPDAQPAAALDARAIADLSAAGGGERVTFDDFPPRQLRVKPAPSSELLVLPVSLRPALR